MQQLVTFVWLTGFLAVLGTDAPSAPKAADADAQERTVDESAKLVDPPSAALAQWDGPSLDTPEPSEWMTKVRRCSHRGSRGFCDGPRMVPMPRGAAKTRADELGLGTTRAVNVALTRAPEPTWVAAVDGEPGETIHFPIEDQSHIFRGFGYVRRGALRHVRHDGVDIAAPVGTPVHAVNDGIVVYADNGVSGYGNLLVIVHADGSTSLYAHLREARVFAGQRVLRGQTVGEIGTTGLSRAPHLHFEYREHGRLIDPAPHFDTMPGRNG